MSTWALILVALCVVAITVAVIPILISLRRSAQRIEAVLLIVERELGPLAGQVQGLVEELRGLAREGRRELERVGTVTERVAELSQRIGRLLNALSGLSRAGQIIGAVAAIKKGLEVFLHRIRRRQGGGDG